MPITWWCLMQILWWYMMPILWWRLVPMMSRSSFQKQKKNLYIWHYYKVLYIHKSKYVSAFLYIFSSQVQQVSGDRNEAKLGAQWRTVQHQVLEYSSSLSCCFHHHPSCHHHNAVFITTITLVIIFIRVIIIIFLVISSSSSSWSSLPPGSGMFEKKGPRRKTQRWQGKALRLPQIPWI